MFRLYKPTLLLYKIDRKNPANIFNNRFLYDVFRFLYVSGTIAKRPEMAWQIAAIMF